MSDPEERVLEAEPVRGWRSSFRSLGNPLFRSYFIGTALTRTGIWTQDVAQSWFIFERTGSGTLVGLLLACEFLPILALSLWVGSFVDRNSRRGILIGTQAAFFVLALCLALVTATGAPIALLFLIAVARGTVASLSITAGAAFVSEIVPQEDMRSALSLNGSLFNFGRIFGALIATLLTHFVSMSACFLVTAAAYVVLLSLIVRMHPDHINAPAPAAKAGITEGLRYAWHVRELRASIVVMFGVGLFAYNSQVFFPMMADDVFHQGMNTYALLLAVYSGGFIIASVVGAAGRAPSSRMMLQSTALLGAMILLESIVAPIPLVGIIVVLLWGSSNGMFASRINTVVQLHSAPHMKGRVMSLWTVVVYGTTPLGAPLVGFIGSNFGSRMSLFVTSMAIFVCFLYAYSTLRDRLD